MSDTVHPKAGIPKGEVTVSSDALFALLFVVNGPGHYLRELQVTRGELFQLATGRENPIDTLVREYNAWANEQLEKQPMFSET